MTPGSARASERLHQRVHAEAQPQIEHRRPVFDQQVGVAVLTDDDGRAPRGLRAGRQCERSGTARPATAPAGRRCRRAASRSRAPASGSRRRASASDTGTKRTVSSALSWPIFHRSASTIVAGQTKPPRLGPSGPRMIGMSPVKSMVPTAYALSWMLEGCSPASPPSGRAQRGFGPISRTPVRLELWWTRHAVANSCVDVRLGEEVGRRVRTDQHRDLPGVGEPRNQRARHHRGRGHRRLLGDVQDVARLQRAAAVAAEQPQREGGAAAEIGRHVDAAAHGEVRAAAGGAQRPQLDDAARGHQRGAKPLQRRAVQRRAHVGAGQRDDGGAAKAQARAGQRALQAGRRRRVADQPVGEPERQRVHRPRRRHADVPVAEAARMILHRRLRAAVEDLDRLRRGDHLVEQARAHRPGRERRRRQRRAAGSRGWSRRPRGGSGRGRRAGARAPPRASRPSRSSWRAAGRSTG